MHDIPQGVFDATVARHIERLTKETPQDDQLVQKAIDAACKELRLIGKRKMHMISLLDEKRRTVLIGAWKRRNDRPHPQDAREELNEINREGFPNPNGAA